MKPGFQRAGTIVQAIVHEAQVERITFMAGSIAYNAFVSLLPLLFLLLAVVTTVGDGRFEANMIALIQSVVTPGAGDVLVEELRNASAGASILGVVVLAWGMLRIFRSLDMAFSNIYETGKENTFLDQITDGIVVFVSIAAVIVGVVALESFISISETSGAVWIFYRLFLICTVALALVPMYYLFPDEPGMGIIETVPGVLFTASTLIVFQSVFSIYIEYSSQTAQNSMLASILLFLTWLYFSGLVILLGVVINAVLSNRSEDVNIEPVLGGVPKTELPEGVDERTVPESELQLLSNRLRETAQFTVSFGDDEVITLPTPDVTRVNTDSSPIPALSDTATLELKWVQNNSLRAVDHD